MGWLMSRGLGYVQQYLIRHLRHSKKPMTFADILARAFPEGSYEADMAKALGSGQVARIRSLRRAMKSLVDDNMLIAIGEGGPADPKRYWLNPMMIGHARARARGRGSNEQDRNGDVQALG
jgi:hypothetical protein